MGTHTASLNSSIKARILEIQEHVPRFIIAIDGRGGAGKSSLARAIVSSLPGAAHFEYDWFHLPQAEIIGPERYDYSRLEREVLAPFKAGQRDFEVARYNWGYLAGKPDGFGSEPARFLGVDVIVLEGCRVLHPALLQSFDLTIWLDTDADEALKRGMRRDIEEYGLDPERVKEAWTEWSRWEREALMLEDRRSLAHIIV
jgi:uridine kinase